MGSSNITESTIFFAHLLTSPLDPSDQLTVNYLESLQPQLGHIDHFRIQVYVLSMTLTLILALTLTAWALALGLSLALALTLAAWGLALALAAGALSKHHRVPITAVRTAPVFVPTRGNSSAS